MNLSKEQELIINKIIDNNIVVEAVAGSGKTTTALEMAKKYLSKKFLLVTYNKDLKENTRRKVKKLNLKNIIVENYNSLPIKFYGKNDGLTDKPIIDIINENCKMINKYSFVPDVLILDEVQDMTSLYYKFIIKLLRDFNNKNISICVLGDSKQTLYQFKGSDFRFLKNADKIFNINEKKWLKLKLSISFRVPNKICDFLNNAFYNYKFIYPSNFNNMEIDYIIYDPYNFNSFEDIIFDQIRKYGIENTFILANSTRITSENNPLNIIINTINKNYPVYVKENIKRVNKNIKKNKVEITTINSTKGMEKDLVIIYGFDEYYYKAYAKEEDFKIPSDKFYVAITRAKQKVILLHSEWSPPICFIEKDKITKYCNVVGNKKVLDYECEMKTNSISEKFFYASNLIEYVSSELIYEFINNLTINDLEFVNENKVDFSKVPFSLETEYNNFSIKEDVSSINGSLITLIKLYEQNNFNNNIENLIDWFLKTKENSEDFVKNKLITRINYLIKKSENSISDLTEISCIIDAIKSGRNYKYKQLEITNFNWLNNDFFIDCLKFLKEIDEFNNIEFEKFITINNENSIILSDICKHLNYIKIEIFGSCDGYNEKDKILWEFKLTKDIDDEMFFQTVMYAYMLHINGFEVKHILLFNLYNLDAKVLKYDFQKFEKILKKIILEKCIINSKNTNEDFLKELNTND